MKEDRIITQICKQCNESYVPTRKGPQKFCSDSCRSRNWYLKQQHKSNAKQTQHKIDKNLAQTDVEKGKNKIEEISFAGMVNTAGGILAVDSLKAASKRIFGNKNNEPSTKGDVQEIKDLINTRYFLIHNIERRYDGCLPYFDMATSSVVYFKDPNFINPADIVI